METNFNQKEIEKKFGAVLDNARSGTRFFLLYQNFEAVQNIVNKNTDLDLKNMDFSYDECPKNADGMNFILHNSLRHKKVHDFQENLREAILHKNLDVAYELMKYGVRLQFGLSKLNSFYEAKFRSETTPEFLKSIRYLNRTLYDEYLNEDTSEDVTVIIPQLCVSSQTLLPRESNINDIIGNLCEKFVSTCRNELDEFYSNQNYDYNFYREKKDRLINTFLMLKRGYENTEKNLKEKILLSFGGKISKKTPETIVTSFKNDIELIFREEVEKNEIEVKEVEIKLPVDEGKYIIPLEILSRSERNEDLYIPAGLEGTEYIRVEEKHIKKSDTLLQIKRTGRSTSAIGFMSKEMKEMKNLTYPMAWAIYLLKSEDYFYMIKNFNFSKFTDLLEIVDKFLKNDTLSTNIRNIVVENIEKIPIYNLSGNLENLNYRGTPTFLIPA